MESHCRLQLGELSSSEIYPTELSNDTEIQISLCLLRSADRICCVCHLQCGGEMAVSS